MSAKIIVLIVAAVVLVGGGVAAYVVMSGDGNNRAASSENGEEHDDHEHNTLSGLLGQDRNVVCTYSTTDQAGNQNSGTVYVAGERFRGDFTVEQPDGSEYHSNTLQTTEYQYGWEEGTKEGYKTKLSTLRGDGSSTPDAPEEVQQSVDQDQEFEFNCDDWNVDESMFEVPSDVTFNDFSVRAEPSQEQLQAACASIADVSAREACESAL